MNYKLMFYDGYDYHLNGGEYYLISSYELKNFRPGKYKEACFETLEEAIKEVKLIAKDECLSVLKSYLKRGRDMPQCIDDLFSDWRLGEIPEIIRENDDVPKPDFSVKDYVKEIQCYLLQSKPQSEKDLRMLIERFQSQTDNAGKPPLPVSVQTKIKAGVLSKEQLIYIRENYQLDVEQLNLIADTFRQIEEYDLAEKFYLKALELSPEYEDPYANLLSLYILQEKYDLCEAIYRKGMSNSSGRKSSIVYQDGRLHYIKGDYNMALSAARSCLNVEQFQDEFSFELAIKTLLALAEQGEEPEKNYEEAKELWKFGTSIFKKSTLLQWFAKYFSR